MEDELRKVGDRRAKSADLPAALVDEVQPCADEAHLGLRVEHRHLLRQPLRSAPVIVVDAGHVLTARLRQPTVERGHLPELSLVPEQADPVIVERPDDSGRPIGARVVDDHELEVGERLAQDALDRLPHVRLTVVDGEQHRHLRVHRTAAAARNRRRAST